ncbi:MAG TPA: CAP domain-containing protein [Candidatus Paceibacterota bacterium]|nr:CAP domain-containing protein [Candidatus Paceibacterota bacterium]
MKPVKDFFRKVKDHFIPSARNVYRPHVLRRPFLVFFLAVILTAEGVFVFDLVARQYAFNFLASVLPGEVIALTNTERVDNNVGRLSENALLDAAAQAKADDMAAKGYFSHVGPDGKEPWAWITGAGYGYNSAGENLAVRFSDSTDVVNAWMASPTHRANIVKPVYQEIGVGVAQGTFQGQPATFVVQYFGTPLSTGLAAAPEQRLAVASAPAAPEEAASPASAPAGAAASADVQGAETQEAAAEGTPPVEEQPQAATAPEPVTASAPVEAASQHSQTPWSSFARELVRGDVQPGGAILWVLGGTATLLIIALALAFFVHIQVQATDMLVGGAVVAVVAISFLALNVKTPYSEHANYQSAAVFGAMPHSGGFIDSVAASTQQ